MFILMETLLLSEDHSWMERSVPLNKLFFPLMDYLLPHQYVLLPCESRWAPQLSMQCQVTAPLLSHLWHKLVGTGTSSIRHVQIIWPRGQRGALKTHMEQLRAWHEGVSSADHTSDVYHPPASDKLQCLFILCIVWTRKTKFQHWNLGQNSHMGSRSMGRRLSMVDYW